MAGCWGKLDAWQQEGVTWMLAAEKAAEEGRGFVVADRMGSGKTHQFAAFLKVSALTPDEATLITCPSTCVTMWRDTLRTMTGNPPYILVPGCSARIKPGKGDVVLASHSFFRTPPCKSMCSAAHVENLMSVEWGRVIVDEAHAVLRQGSMSRCTLDRVEARVRWAITGCSADGALARHFKDVTQWTRSRDQEILQRQGSDPAVKSIVHRLPFASEAEQWLSDRVHELKRGGGPEAHLRCRQVSAGFRVFMHAVQMQTVSEKELSGYGRKCADLLRLFLEKYDRFSMNSRNVGTKASYIRDTIVASS
ncbi:Transcription termination factor 2, partial [Tetrabaena socialis]